MEKKPESLNLLTIYSELSKKILVNFDDEVKNFIQVCPKEMISKLENPITLNPKIKEVS